MSDNKSIQIVTQHQTDNFFQFFAVFGFGFGFGFGFWFLVLVEIEMTIWDLVIF
jgi:hypothetical protein